MKIQNNKVLLTGNAKEVYLNLKNNDKEKVLFNSINEKISFLKQNSQYGIHIQKNKIPKKYKEKYSINNLWKVNLSKFWRMLYTVKKEDEMIILIIDILDHKEYNKTFKYKKK